MKITVLPPRATVFLFALCTALTLPTLAQKQKSTDLSGFPLLWSAKKTPLTGPFIPGLNAALLLSDEQTEKLIAAREETLSNEKFQKLGAVVKLNPNASDAEREAARQANEEARDQFKTRVENILTAEQRKLVERLNTVFGESLTAAQEAYRGQLEQLVKTDKARAEELRQEVREKSLKDFKARLEGMLSKEQWAALAKAAAAEEAVAKNSVKIKKP
jgi:hypothetical protein